MAGTFLRPTAMTWLVLLGLMAAVVPCPGQQDEMEVIERVTQLLEQLKSPDVAKRDEAQAEILKLGPIALGSCIQKKEPSGSPGIRIVRPKNESISI